MPQIKMLYTLNLHNVICQLYFNKNHEEWLFMTWYYLHDPEIPGWEVKNFNEMNENHQVPVVEKSVLEHYRIPLQLLGLGKMSS